MDQQTVYKDESEYYRLQRIILESRGYKITEDKKDYSVFVKSEDSGED